MNNRNSNATPVITPLKTPLKMVIFDWDGTLMDSVNLIVECLLNAAQAHHIPLLANDAKNIIGLGLPEAMHVLFPQHPQLHADIIRSYAQHYLAKAEQSQLFTGASQLFDSLDALNIDMAIATGKSRIGLDRVITHTNTAHRFKITRCASETASKPNPLMLQQILDECNLAPEQCAMVGDSIYDLEMAANINMPRIAITHGVHNASQLGAYNPLATVDNIAMLQEVLMRVCR